MRIAQIQVVAEVLARLKPALCEDLDFFFKLKATRKRLTQIITDNQSYIQDVMEAHKVPVHRGENRDTYFFEDHEQRAEIESSLQKLASREYDIEPLAITKSDYKLLVKDLQLAEIELLDELLMPN